MFCQLERIRSWFDLPKNFARSVAAHVEAPPSQPLRALADRHRFQDLLEMGWYKPQKGHLKSVMLQVFNVKKTVENRLPINNSNIYFIIFLREMKNSWRIITQQMRAKIGSENLQFQWIFMSPGILSGPTQCPGTLGPTNDGQPCHVMVLETPRMFYFF